MCPPGVDQTERSPQQWQILAPQLKEVHRLSTTWKRCDNKTPRQILFSDIPWHSWSKLARPTRPKHRISSCKPSSSQFKPTKTTPAPLERMPAELLALILDSDVLERKDVLALGISSRYLWQHAIQHVQRAIYCTVAPWADTPIACLGTYLTTLPRSFAQENPEPTTRPLVRERYVDQMCWARQLNWTARRQYSAVEDRGSEGEAWKVALHAHLQTAKVPARFADQLERDVVGCQELFFPSASSQWALRNLSTREFERCRAPAGTKPAHVDHPDAEWIRVDDVLMMRICWSNEPRGWRAEDPYCNIFFHGLWAGHRFEIVALHPETSLTGDEQGEWRDVTKELVEEARWLWRRMKTRQTEENVDVEERLRRMLQRVE